MATVEAEVVAAENVRSKAHAASRRNGPAAAAILAAGIGGMFLGLATSAAEAVPAIKQALTLVASVGPLSGKTGVAILAWLVAGLALGLLWRCRDVPFGRVYSLSLILLAVGFVGTFPLFYEAIAAR